MVYEPNVPLTGQSLGETRDPIKNNFTDINTAFGANHVPLTTDTSGKHNFLQMPEQSSAPTTLANEGALYTKEGPNGVTEFYVRAESNGDEFQISNFSVSGNDATFGTNPGWTTLPGGLIMQYGSFVPGALSGTENFVFAFPNAIYNINLTIEATATRTVLLKTSSVTGFTWSVAIATNFITNVYWTAIGN